MSDVTEYDASTGEVIVRKFTKSEKNLVASLSVHGQDQIDAINTELEQKFLEKQQAVSALEQLGLTEAQAKAVIGL